MTGRTAAAQDVAVAVADEDWPMARQLLSPRRRNFRSRWRKAAWRSDLVPESVRGLLWVLDHHMNAQGYVSVPRAKLAELLNRSPQRITERLQKAVEAGLLERVSPGYRGHTAVYRATLPEPEAAPPAERLEAEEETAA